MKVKYRLVDQFNWQELLFLEEDNTLLMPILGSDYNFSRQSYKGHFLLKKRILEAQQSLSILWLDYKTLDDLMDPLDKIEYLESLGIHNKNLTGEYHFEAIYRMTPHKEDPFLTFESKIWCIYV